MTEGATARDRETVLDVPGMDCASCASKIERSVESLDGVREFDPDVATGRLRVGYDSARTNEAAIRERVSAAGYEVVDDDREVRLDVPEMDCPTCAGKVENAVDGVAGVRDFETRPTAGTVDVRLEEDASVGSVTEAVESAGYEVTGTSDEGDDSTERADVWTDSRALATYAGGALLAVGLAVEFLAGGVATVGTVGAETLSVADVLFLVAAAVAGRAILRDGYYSARNLNLDIDLLMSVAMLSAVGATVLSSSAHLFPEAATLAVLFSLAELLERYSMEQARNSLRELMELSPDEATIRRDDNAGSGTDGDAGSGADGDTVTVPVEDVEVGDVAVIKPGEKVPLDGRVVEGHSAVDESPVTGESVPVDKTVDDEVYAGSVNEEGYLEVEVTSVAGEDTLSRIVDLVEDANRAKTDREQFVERFSGYYTPIMVALAIAVAAVPPLAFGAPWVEWFVAGITMLVLACPCAFVISTPVTVVSGITSAARNGVLVKGGEHLEAMGGVDAIAVDKTGTLTRGELAVTDVIPTEGHTENDVLRCAQGVESRSEHPIGEAIVAHAEAAVDGSSTSDDATAADARDVEDFESVTGEGVRATLDGTPHYAGKPDLFEQLGFDLGHVHVVPDDDVVADEVRDRCERAGCLDLAADTIPRLQADGKTVVLVGTDDRLEGVIAVADEVRSDAEATVSRLQELGVSVVMLTGDNERTAAAIAEQVGVDDYRAGLLPDEKVDAVEAVRDRYGSVAMVGDGINDAPALATADVGVAMGAAGTDTAIETADVALMGDNLSRLPYLYELATDANGIIRQNIWASLGLKLVLAAGVPLGLVSVALAVLAGDAGMTLGVTGNAMRLSRLSPD
ncbi:MAG: heavy metal translocating P-type ATPase [Haloarculaceae archaeon]